MIIFMATDKTIKIIKSKSWEICVTRPGYLQPKLIVLRAETTPFKITPKVVVKIKDDLWVKGANIFNVQRRNEAFGYFKKGFEEDKNWPLKIYKRFKYDEKEAGFFIGKIKNLKETDKVGIFSEYNSNLLKIQNYYAIAEVLADYCEDELRGKNNDLLKFAFPYSKLDMENFESSLRRIKKSRNKDKLIQNHVKEFAWILTGYNIVKIYKKKDVLNEVKTVGKEAVRLEFTGESQEAYLLKSLQIAIYIRNRIKELSQQLWFYIEPISVAIAKDFGISRNDFFQLTYEEVVESMKKEKCTVSGNEIARRNDGFICGFLSGKEILITGKISRELYDYFTRVDEKKISEIKGVSASKGLTRGRVKIITTPQDFKKFNKGDILVAPMTTPDYIILMRKASAFITDEGGVSCHAAIVAREMKRPCIIGTKIATRVLKDGQMVEVDADNGIVKILK